MTELPGTEETLFACLMGIVLVLIVMPWGYVVRHYLKAPGAPWTRARPDAGP